MNKLCKNNTKASDVKDSPVKLKMKESGDSLVFAPFDMDEDLTQRNIGNSLVTCILPCSIECLNFIDSQTFKSRENNKNRVMIEYMTKVENKHTAFR